MIDLATVLTSAGVAAVVTAGMQLLNGHLERRARHAEQVTERETRRRQVLLEKALEIALERIRFGYQVAKENRQRTEIYDQVVMAEVYYKWLAHLFEHGELPPGANVDRPDDHEVADGTRGME